MKTVNVTFTDKEHEGLTKKKGTQSWHDFILRLANETKNKEDPFAEEQTYCITAEKKGR